MTTGTTVNLPYPKSFEDILCRVSFRSKPVNCGLLDRWGEWQRLETLQTALFGKVILYQHQAGDEYVVIKRLVNDKMVANRGGGTLNDGLIERLLREQADGENPGVEIGVSMYLSQINANCPYILQVRPCWQDDVYTYLPSDFCAGGGLFEKVAASRGLHGDTVRRYMRQLLGAVQFLHLHGLSHRDISLENILIAETSGDSIRLMDFGAAAPIYDQDGAHRLYRETHVGKTPYRAPEMYIRREKGRRIDPSYRADLIDIFACGLVMYFMFTGSSLWESAQEPDRIFKFIQARGLPQLLRTAQYARFGRLIEREAITVIAGLLQFDPTQRLRIDQALSMPWFASQ